MSEIKKGPALFLEPISWMEKKYTPEQVAEWNRQSHELMKEIEDRMKQKLLTTDPETIKRARDAVCDCWASIGVGLDAAQDIDGDLIPETDRMAFSIINNVRFIAAYCEGCDLDPVKEFSDFYIEELKSAWNKDEYREHIEAAFNKAFTIEQYRPETDRSLSYQEYLQTDHWQKMRKMALAWHGAECSLCGATKRLNVHHRRYNNLGNPYLEIFDLCVLCQDCHGKHHGKEWGHDA